MPQLVPHLMASLAYAGAEQAGTDEDVHLLIQQEGIKLSKFASDSETDSDSDLDSDIEDEIISDVSDGCER